MTPGTKRTLLCQKRAPQCASRRLHIPPDAVKECKQTAEKTVGLGVSGHRCSCCIVLLPAWLLCEAPIQCQNSTEETHRSA